MQAMKRSRVIHFDLTGMSSSHFGDYKGDDECDYSWLADRGAKFGWTGGNATNFELSEIRKRFLLKTIFWKNGVIVPSPFAKGPKDCKRE